MVPGGLEPARDPSPRTLTPRIAEATRAQRCWDLADVSLGRRRNRLPDLTRRVDLPRESKREGKERNRGTTYFASNASQEDAANERGKKQIAVASVDLEISARTATVGNAEMESLWSFLLFREKRTFFIRRRSRDTRATPARSPRTLLYR